MILGTLVSGCGFGDTFFDVLEPRLAVVWEKHHNDYKENVWDGSMKKTPLKN